LYRADKTNFEEFFYFFLDCWCFSRIYQMNILSDRFGIKIGHDFMLKNSWVDAWNFLIRPEKNVAKFFE
jgi:hypothetical protein